MSEKCILLGYWEGKRWKQDRAVYSRDGISPTIMACIGGKHQIGNIYVIEERPMEDPNEAEVTLLGGLGEMKSNRGTQFYNQDRVYSMEGLCPAIPTSFNPYFGEKGAIRMKKLRVTIRKLTEGECYRLQGFEEQDTIACKEAGQAVSSIYHQAGDSICTTVLVAIIGSLFEVDYKPIIRNYSEKLHREVCHDEEGERP